ncbi:substrate-binding domain-containing protein [Geoalkalibacter halelectricus]|uniref:substrate-binding domain-containing protein n=1 Tax=Geoalkalibacter halelectricus TaxID=2847045 RepID=UPI003D192148
MKKLLSTKQVAQLLGVNEKMVYTLITDKGLPATKITGKWVFPEYLVEQWVESKTINYPVQREPLLQQPNLLVLAGSNDILLDRALALFMRTYPEQVAVFGNLGSLGGLNALRRGLCQVATSHLPEEDKDEFNFSYAAGELDSLPAVVNFSRREQGFLLAPGNPLGISSLREISEKNLRVVNRPLGTSTRLVFDRELVRAGIEHDQVPGYEREVQRHMDVGLEILGGRADIGPAIRPVAALLGLDFLPLHWERFDLIIPKDSFFLKGVQLFLDILRHEDFQALARELPGYDLSLSGRMMYPKNT